MAVPARKVSKTRGATRRAHMALSKKAETKCLNCGAMIKPHRVCKECGTYKNKTVIENEKVEEKKETKKETKKEVKKTKSKKEEK